LVAQFEVYKDSAGDWRWRLKSAGNYKTIADSAEGYESKDDCEHGIELVKEQASNAEVEYTDE
jgi:uncharacterized protein YegP (UPF0339 family)